MTLKYELLRLVGASLYWGEGTKSRKLKRGGMIYAIEFTNVDVNMILVFLRFLREIIGAYEDRIRAQVFLYPDNSEISTLKYWSKITKIPLTRFQKPIFVKRRSVRFANSPYGIMKIRYSHKEHFLKIQGIIGEIIGEVA